MIEEDAARLDKEYGARLDDPEAWLDQAWKELSWERLVRLMAHPALRESVTPFFARHGEELDTEQLLHAFIELRDEIRPLWNELLERNGLRERLHELIRQSSPRIEAAPSYRHHVKLWSTFAFQPAAVGHDIDCCLALLAGLGERDALLAYLDELPWGVDRQPTVTLIRLLANLQEARLVERLHGDRDPFVLLHLIQEMAEFRPQEAQEALVSAMLSGRVGAEGRRLLERFPQLARRVEDVPTGKWDSLDRALLARWMRSHGAFGCKVAGWKDRLDLGVTEAFLRVRIDHMGCGTIPAVIALLGFGLFKLLGPLPQPQTYGVICAFVGWLVLAVMGTASTHFSGLETNKDLRASAYYYWFLTLAAWGAIAYAYFSARDVTSP